MKWEVKAFDKDNRGGVRIWGDGLLKCKLLGEDAEANAELICQSVNERESMSKRVEELEGVLKSIQDILRYDCSEEAVDSVENLAKKALEDK